MEALIEILKWVAGALLTVMVPSTAWLLHSVIQYRTDIALLKQKADTLDGVVASMAALAQRQALMEQALANHTDNAVTVECVREVIEEALNKRDKAADDRRTQYDELRKLQIKEAVRSELEQVFPKLLREAGITKHKGATGA